MRQFALHRQQPEKDSKMSTLPPPEKIYLQKLCDVIVAIAVQN